MPVTSEWAWPMVVCMGSNRKVIFFGSEIIGSIHPLSSSSPKQEIQRTCENSSSKEIPCTDEPSCSNQAKSSDSESSILDNSSLIQTTENNFNKTQLGENSNNCSLESIKVEENPQTNSPPLFNPLSLLIKEIPSAPPANLENNNKMEIELFSKIFHTPYK